MDSATPVATPDVPQAADDAGTNSTRRPEGAPPLPPGGCRCLERGGESREQFDERRLLAESTPYGAVNRPRDGRGGGTGHREAVEPRAVAVDATRAVAPDTGNFALAGESSSEREQLGLERRDLGGTERLTVVIPDGQKKVDPDGRTHGAGV